MSTGTLKTRDQLDANFLNLHLILQGMFEVSKNFCQFFICFHLLNFPKKNSFMISSIFVQTDWTFFY